MKYIPKCNDVKLIEPHQYEDDRGYFCELMTDEWCINNFGHRFVQENQSYSKNPYTVRGLHYQKDPCAQAKLIEVIKGSILDVILDLRKDSSTFMVHDAVRIDGGLRPKYFYVPAGFAHGFITLESYTVVRYKVSSIYSKQSEGGISFFSDRIGFNINDYILDLTMSDITISEKDANLPIDITYTF